MGNVNMIQMSMNLSFSILSQKLLVTIRPSPFFSPFSVVRPIQILAFSEKKIGNDVFKPFLCHIRVSVVDPFSHAVLIL